MFTFRRGQCVCATVFATALAAPQLRASSISLQNLETVPIVFGPNVYQVAINDAGDIAGTSSNNGNEAGFVIPHSGSAYLIQKPGAEYTEVTGINTAGTAVGYYLTSTFQLQGFSYSGGTFTPVSAGPYTYAAGINNHGDITGYESVPGDTGTGFLIHGGVTTTFFVPGHSLDTFATAVNDSDQVVGYYNGASDGFLRQSNGTITTFGFEANGINNSGIIVGTAAGGNDTSVGAVMLGGIDYTFSFPGAINTFIDGINNENEVVGTYYDANFNSHIFVGQIGAPTPEPSTMALCGGLLAGVFMWRRRGASS